MKTAVLGSGGWGTALALVLCDNGHDVTLWSHSPEKAGQMAQTRENSLLKGVLLPESLHITGELDCLSDAELVISAPPSFAVRATATVDADRIAYQFAGLVPAFLDVSHTSSSLSCRAGHGTMRARVDSFEWGLCCICRPWCVSAGGGFYCSLSSIPSSESHIFI